MLSDIEQFAKEYLDRTETYDRQIATGEIVNDEIRLATNEERKKSLAFARSVMKEIAERARPHFGWGEVHKAIQHSHSWYRFETWEKECQ